LAEVGPQTGLSEAICRHVAETPFAALPEGAVQAARRVLLDACGVMYAASGLSADVAPFVAMAREACGDLRGGARGGPCDVLGTGLRASAPMAALANGAMAHALDYEDAFDAAPGHPNASLVPSVLALAQASSGVDGETLLAALAVGCDLACRIGLSLKRPMEEGGWYPPPIVGAYGAVAGCARVSGLDWRQARDAMSLMLCQATMPGEIMHSPQTVIRAVREAFPAQAAVISAQLAKGGVAGFEAPFEGKAGFFQLYAGGQFDAGVLLDGLGQRYWGEELSFKPWPACRGTHAFIELAQVLAEQHRFGWRDVREVVVHTDAIHRMLMEPKERKQAPMVAIDAKFSIPFTVGLSLVRGKVTLDDFSAEALADRDVLAVASRVVAAPAGDHGRAKGSGGAMTIRLADGREVAAEVADALGSPKRPMSDDALMAKFVDCLGRAAQSMSEQRARRLGERILSIGRGDDVGAIFREA
jgi:2-methylcitrate dehydratase PrpD